MNDKGLCRLTRDVHSTIYGFFVILVLALSPMSLCENGKQYRAECVQVHKCFLQEDCAKTENWKSADHYTVYSVIKGTVA